MKVISKKLGRHRVDGKQVDGFADIDEMVAYIDSRATKKYELYLRLHELLHLLRWDLKENEVKRIARGLTNEIWKNGYRKCDL